MNAAKALVRKAFARAAASYEEVAEFQRAAAGQLMEGLPFDLSPARILDSGCGTGHGLPLLSRRWPTAQVVSLDFAFAMVQQLARGSGQLCGDAECLPLVAEATSKPAPLSLTLSWTAWLTQPSRTVTDEASVNL